MLGSNPCSINIGGGSMKWLVLKGKITMGHTPSLINRSMNKHQKITLRVPSQWVNTTNNPTVTIFGLKIGSHSSLALVVGLALFFFSLCNSTFSFVPLAPKKILLMKILNFVLLCWAFPNDNGQWLVALLLLYWKPLMMNTNALK